MIDLRLGDCVDVMRTMPDRSVHTCVTSPPYFGLRDYGADGQIGLEKTPGDYVGRMVDVFREVRRVLRDDGSLWLNLGDSYGSGNSGQTKRDSSGGVGGGKVRGTFDQPSSKANPGKAPVAGMFKQLLGIPWRVAFALQADGWYLRSDIIWAKPNPMPESVRDRPTKAHEYLFLLSKSATYHYDADAIKEATRTKPHAPGFASFDPNSKRKDRLPGNEAISRVWGSDRRNRRSVWTVATRPYKGAHFATFPPKLIEPCILAGTSEAGCCQECGKPWERVVERTQMVTKRSLRGILLGRFGKTAASGTMVSPARSETLGFRPACSCNAGPAVPCTVLDPFNGAGTTGVVAQQHGRDYVGIDLNPEYLALSRARLSPAHAVA